MSSTKSKHRSVNAKVKTARTPVKKLPAENRLAEKRVDPQKLQVDNSVKFIFSKLRILGSITDIEFFTIAAGGSSNVPWESGGENFCYSR